MTTSTDQIELPLALIRGVPPKFARRTAVDGAKIAITHRDELESELTTIFERLAPEVVGPKYTVLGTVELRAWRRGMRTATTIDDVLRHTAPFTTGITVEYTPATWVPTRPPRKSRPE